MIKKILDSRDLFGLTWARMGLLLILSISAAFLEGLGMSMFLPVLQYIEKGQDAELLASTSENWRNLLELFSHLNLKISLFSLIAAAVVVMLLRVIAIYARQLYISWLGFNIQHAIRSNLFCGYLGLDYGAFTTLSSGSTLNILTTETRRAAGSFSALFALVSNIIVTIGLVGVLLWISISLTLLVVSLLIVSAGVVSYYIRYTRRYSHATTGVNSTYSDTVLERLLAFRLIKLTATSATEVERVRAVSFSLRNLNYSMARIGARVDFIMEPMALLTGGVILYFGISMYNMALAEIGIFSLILLRLLPLGKEILRSRQTFNSSSGSLSAVLNGYANALTGVEHKGGCKLFEGVKQSIELKNVSFTYPETKTPAVNDVSITITKGMITALVGPSGSGKSTLADLIMCLRLPQEGRILYDGMPGIEFDLSSLRKCMAFVSQDAVIFNDTVAANLRFGRKEATDAELWDALEKSQATEFVKHMKDGLETFLGERGTRLSGGQKQRLSLARALVQRTSVMILDEPTSSLDSETEEAIQVALGKLRSELKMTILIIAHRLSTIRSADKIIVLRDGVVVEQGNHDQLMLSAEWYSRMIGAQVVEG
jgi:subfamily B ATP-binding cassette protein MsbA